MTTLTTPYVDALGRPCEKRCDECQGSGVVWAREWRVWTKTKDAAENRFKAAPDYKPGAWLDWWDAYVAENPMPNTAEQHQCGECDGIGATLTETGAALLNFIRRYS